MLPAIPIGLCLFESIHLVGAHTTAAADGFHEHGERNPAIGKSCLEIVPIMECQWGTDTFLGKIFEELVFVEAIDGALGRGAQRNHAGVL